MMTTFERRRDTASSIILDKSYSVKEALKMAEEEWEECPEKSKWETFRVYQYKDGKRVNIKNWLN